MAWIQNHRVFRHWKASMSRRFCSCDSLEMVTELELSNRFLLVGARMDDLLGAGEPPLQAALAESERLGPEAACERVVVEVGVDVARADAEPLRGLAHGQQPIWLLGLHLAVESGGKLLRHEVGEAFE